MDDSRVPVGDLLVDNKELIQVAVLSAAVLRAIRRGHGEDQASFAERAGVARDVVVHTEDGTQPAWSLPFDEFIALADVARASLAPAIFETAAACDLVLTCVLNCERAFAADVLAEPASRNLARALLRLAIAGELDGAFSGLDRMELPGDAAVLSVGQLELLRERAGVLAASDSPDAWVGAEILTMCRGRRP